MFLSKNTENLVELTKPDTYSNKYQIEPTSLKTGNEFFRSKDNEIPLLTGKPVAPNRLHLCFHSEFQPEVKYSDFVGV